MEHIEQAFNRIESEEFLFRVRVTGSLRSLLLAAQDDHGVKTLLKLLADKSLQYRLAERIVHLSKLQIDSRYRHPFDTALGIYLLTLNLKDAALARFASNIIISVPNGFLARKIGFYILERFCTPLSAGSGQLLAKDIESKVKAAGASDAVAQVGFLHGGTESGHISTSQIHAANHSESGRGTWAIQPTKYVPSS